LLDNPSSDAIFAVRQISLMFGKVKMDCSKRRTSKAFDKFVKCEKIVDEFDVLRTEDMKMAFARIGRLLFKDIFTNLDRKIYEGDILPRHSSGAVAERLRGNAKYDLSEWTDRLEEIFPAMDYLAASWLQFDWINENVNYLEPGSERPVRVITVPKTLKTPRIIAIEPTCMQYMQQGILEAIVEEVEANNSVRSLISWSSQEPNRLMARKSSLTGEFATLDLSDASDRVSNQLVRLLTNDFPYLAAGIDACRSRKADVPGHGIISLSKFASMGSALCFPMESMVFMTIVFVGIENVLNRRLRKSDIKSLLGQVRTYGDDIIVPVRYTHAVIGALEAYGLKVNTDKSFWTGKFRESCGSEWYDNHDVSIVRMRTDFPKSRRHVPELVSTVAMRNLLYKRAIFSHTVDYLDNLIERIIPFPVVESTSPALGRHSFLPATAEGWDVVRQRPVVKAAVLVPQLPASKLDGYGALLKFYLKRGTDPYADSRHLERAGRPDVVGIKIIRQVPLY